VDGKHAVEFAPSTHTHDAMDIISGTLSTERYSAYRDLSAEGYLDNNDSADILTRSQADVRYVNEGQANSVTSAMITDGAVTSSDLADEAALAEILDDDGPGSGLNADMVDGLHASSFPRIGYYYIPGEGGSVVIPIPHYRAFQISIGEAFAKPQKAAWMSGIANDRYIAWVGIDSTGSVVTGSASLDSTTTILTLGTYITLKCPGNGNYELILTSGYEDVLAFIVW
jgi:hypothetical protein